MEDLCETAPQKRANPLMEDLCEINPLKIHKSYTSKYFTPHITQICKCQICVKLLFIYF
jgi:hypothetical protein